MANDPTIIERVSADWASNPFTAWLGLKVLAIDADGIAVTLPWREEFNSDSNQHVAHRGILDALIEAASNFAIACKIGRLLTSIDMQFDYYQTATPGDLRTTGRMGNLAEPFSSVEACVFDKNGTLVAKGRAVYWTVPL